MKHYEDSMHRKDTRTIITIFILLGILMLVVVLACTSGCVTKAKNAFKEDPTPVPTPEPTQNESFVTVETPSPEPAPTLTEGQILAQTGGHYMGQWVSWNCENASGQKDVTVHTTVYDFRQYNFIRWWSVLWGQYFIDSPGENSQFVFVMVHTYSDEGDTTTWGIQPDQFLLQVGDKMYERSAQFPLELRVKELEEVWDYRHVESIKPYGYLWRYGANGASLAEPLQYMKSGPSNGWDGYIVFAVPRGIQSEEIKVIGNFHNLAPSQYWILK